MGELTKAIDSVKKKYGDGAIMHGTGRSIEGVKGVSTGSFAIDAASGVGGFPRGRISEIYGPESSGKTTVCLQAVAEVQREGGKAAYVDTEHALDLDYAQNGLGVNVDDLYISQPDSGEEALDICEVLINSGEIDLVVVDSVASLVPQAEIDADAGQVVMAGTARLMSRSCKKLAGAVRKSDAALVFVNQTRQKVGMVFGSPETQPGGRALKFHASMRIELKKVGNIKSGDEFVGQSIMARFVKNKVAPPLKKALYDLYFGKGISNASSILEMGLKEGLIKKQSSYFVFEDGHKINGKVNTIAYLDENKEIYNSLKSRLLGS